MTREQRLRLKSRRIPQLAREYIRLLDRANDETDDLELLRIQDRSRGLARRMTDDEYEAACAFLHRLEREDAMRYR